MIDKHLTPFQLDQLQRKAANQIRNAAPMMLDTLKSVCSALQFLVNDMGDTRYQKLLDKVSQTIDFAEDKR